MNKYIKINLNDNVCIAIENLTPRDIINIEGTPTIKDTIKTGH